MVVRQLRSLEAVSRAEADPRAALARVQAVVMRIAAALALCCAFAPPARASPDGEFAPFDAAQPASACSLTVLRELGWRIEIGHSANLEVAGGAPCRRPDLAAAHRAGDLRIRLPAATTPQTDATIAALLDHPATLCAFKFGVGAATRRAVDRLVANQDYRFNALQFGWVAFGEGARRRGWEPIYSFGRGFRPHGSNTRAIEAFYTGRVRSECGVGRQIAQYAAQAELYGPAAFDAEFAPDEIVIGTFNKLQRTDSILLGAHAGDFEADGLARKASRRGRQGYAGLPGFIVHAFDRDTLDDIDNQAQNFVVYDVSAAAADSLRTHGGFAHYNRVNREIWDLARGLQRRDLSRDWFERAVYGRDPALRERLAPAQRASLARIDALLADPFYREFRIYVHRSGVRPVGYHIVRLLDRNPRTPFRIELTLHNLHTTLFRRYLAHRLAACASAHEPAAPRPPAVAAAE